MELTVVIVNYNVKYYLAQCLQSVLRATRAIETEIWIVDNASTDGSETYIKSRFPEVTYVYNTENVGFARGCNQARRKTSGRYVLLLNPDTIVGEDTLKQALRFMNDHPETGAAGVKMMDACGRFLPESKRGYPTLGATFGKLSGLGRVFPHQKKLNSYYRNDLSPDGIHPVDVLAGAFMLMPRTALEDCGLLDETFFMYGEDIDLSCRIKEGGYENYYLPYPILHYKGESTDYASYHHVKVFYNAMELFFQKHDAKRHHWIGRWAVRIGIRGLIGYKCLLVFLKKKLRRKHPEPLQTKFAALCPKEHVEKLQQLLHDNNLPEASCYNRQNASLTLPQGGYTHIIIDSTAYTYAQIIDILPYCHQQKVSLATYHPQEGILILPGNVYHK